ncbi:MAG: UPF0175 family protein [Verrucomicrobia bacterium]|nr:UPF0175 family protein [Verrucomicrobiota bacterium]
MMLELPEKSVASARLTSAEARLALAIWLYQAERLTFGDASELAGVSMAVFAVELERRGLPVAYNSADLAGDVANLQALGRL